MAAAAKLLWPVLVELIRQAAQGSVMHNDDTGMRILRLAREPGDKRTGTFTSGIVSIVGAWTIALFAVFTGLCALSAVVVLAPLVSILLYIGKRGLPGLSLGFFTVP